MPKITNVSVKLVPKKNEDTNIIKPVLLYKNDDREWLVDYYNAEDKTLSTRRGLFAGEIRLIKKIEDLISDYNSSVDDKEHCTTQKG